MKLNKIVDKKKIQPVVKKLFGINIKDIPKNSPLRIVYKNKFK